MDVMARKKKESTPGENLAKQIIEQYNPKSVEDMQNALSKTATKMRKIDLQVSLAGRFFFRFYF